MDQAVDKSNDTHTQRKITADEIVALSDRVFVAGFQARREDLLLASALLRRLSYDGDIEQIWVWNLQQEAI